MSAVEIVGIIIGTICFLIWVPAVVSWIRRRVSIPRYIHLVALATTCVGLGSVIGLTACGFITLTLGIALVGLPAALTYFGWFWLFGPEWLQSTKT